MISNAAEAENTLDGMYISENNYTGDMKSIVEPYINSGLESGHVDAQLYYEKYVELVIIGHTKLLKLLKK